MLQELGIDLSPVLGAFLPRLLAALAILVVGWIVALIASSVVKRLLHRTSFDNRIAAWVAGEKGGEVQVEQGAGTAVFWIVMLFVLVGVFQTLQLSGVTEPLNLLLGEVAAFAPKIVGAVLLAAVAGVLAMLLRRLVTNALSLARADERLAGDGTSGAPVSKTLGEATYWLVWLLFLPAILSTLELTGLLEPVQALLNRAMAFLPNLFAAALILLVGWFVATLVRRIVSNLLAAAGVDRFGERAGVSRALGGGSLSGVVGAVVYVLVLLPVGIAALNALQIEAVTQPASNMLNALLTAVPRLFAASIVVGLAWFVGRVVGDMVARTLAAVGFNNLFTSIGFTSAPVAGEGAARRQPSDVAGGLVLITLVLFATVEAAGLLGFVALQTMISSFIVLGGRVLLGLGIFAVGLYLAGLAARVIRSSGVANAVLLATAARVAVLILVGAMALRQMGLANEIINLAFGLTVGALAIAAAIAFGIGGRDIAARELEAWVQQIKGRH